VIERPLVPPSPAEVHDQARRQGITLGEPRFMLVERTYDLPGRYLQRNVADELADWLIAVTQVLQAETDDRLFRLLARLALMSLEYSFDHAMSTDAARRFIPELYEAFDLLRHGNDPHEARAAFVLALVHATKHLT